MSEATSSACSSLAIAPASPSLTARYSACSLFTWFCGSIVSARDFCTRRSTANLTRQLNSSSSRQTLLLPERYRRRAAPAVTTPATIRRIYTVLCTSPKVKGAAAKISCLTSCACAELPTGVRKSAMPLPQRDRWGHPSPGSREKSNPLREQIARAITDSPVPMLQPTLSAYAKSPPSAATHGITAGAQWHRVATRMSRST